MVRRLLTLLLLAWLSGLAGQLLAAPALDVTAQYDEIELGKPLHVEVIARDIEAPISNIDLSPLMAEFGIIVDEIASQDNNAVQLVSLRLYPRWLGELEIPALELAGYSSARSMVRAHPARSVLGELSIESTISSSLVWQRQQVLVTARITSPNKFATIEAEAFKQAGFDTIRLATHRATTPDGRFVLATGWALYPRVAGNLTIQPPAINYRHSGKVQRKFFPASTPLQVKALPGYIPPLMPVGEFSLSSDYRIESWLERKIAVSLQSQSHSMLARELPGLADQLDGTGEPQHVTEPIYSVTTGHDGLVSMNTVSGHYQLSGTGMFHLPASRLAWFDPLSGRIRHVSYEPVTLFMPHPLLAIPALLMLLAAVAWLARLLVHKLVASMRLRRRRARLVTKMHTASSPAELYNLLREYADLSGWGNNLSLGQWQQVYREHRDLDPGETLAKLSDACYGSMGLAAGRQSELNNSVVKLLV